MKRRTALRPGRSNSHAGYAPVRHMLRIRRAFARTVIVGLSRVGQNALERAQEMHPWRMHKRYEIFT
jgi:hypothetical protein